MPDSKPDTKSDSDSESPSQLPVVPIPPKEANVTTTCCDYCVVGCGYKVYTWPVEGESGGPTANDNAFAVDFPVESFSGEWVSPNQHNRCIVDGTPHHVVVAPDSESSVVNLRGNHSIRGGCIAQKVYNPNGPTKDRLASPLLRVGGRLQPITWDLAMDVMASVSQYVLEQHGTPAWGMKTYSYQYFENTYAISKLAFEAIQTPAYAPHDKPGPGNDTAGVDDAGIMPFSASYDDWKQSDVVMISGTDPYETKTVLFTDWLMRDDQKLIFVLPRRTTGVAYAEQNGGLFLQITPGTDALLHLAMIRIILENNWQDDAFIADWVANRWEIDSGFGRGTRNTPWQWRTTWSKLGASYDEYRDWILDLPDAEIASAARVTGLPAEKILAAAEMVAKPLHGVRPKSSFAFEKGNYWSNNYLNTASYATLGILCGAGNRDGQVISRMGGHQRGWYGAASYPRVYSPEKDPGRRKKEIDLDRWVEAGHLRFAWVIGTTWVQAMAASQELAASFRRQTSESPHQIESAERDHIVDVLKQRVDARGMVVVHQDIYLRDPIGSEFADLVLPAAGWGEENFTRCNGERRLRIYNKFCDAPGDAKPDWWIISQFAQRMGFKDFDWSDSNDVFEKAARSGRNDVLNYHPLVIYAEQAGMTGHDLLRELGTHGIQTPVRFRHKPTESDAYRQYSGSYSHPDVDGVLVGTKRLHDTAMDFGTPEGPTVIMKWMHAFKSHTGKALLHKTPWSLFSDFYERIQPKNGEFWVTSGRINENWQTLFDDDRRPYIRKRWPEQWIEIHPDDAQRLDVRSGDRVRIENDDVLIQVGGFVGVDQDDLSYTSLNDNGHIRIGHGAFEAIAIVTDAVMPGLLWTNALNPRQSPNSVVHRVPDPITNRYRFKLGKGRLTRLGTSEYSQGFEQFSFQSRNVTRVGTPR